jgi:signal transduction histidine kinase
MTTYPRRTLRARLALLYASLFTGSGVVLLIIAGLPLLTFSHAYRAPGPGIHRTGASGPAHVGPGYGTDLGTVLLYSGIALAVLVPVSIALGWLVADRALRPLRTITSAARAISARSLDERLNLDASYDEFAELAETLDDLFSRLGDAFESQRHFVANASHELRTPLTAERTLIQVALADPDATAASLRSTCQQLLALGEQQGRLIDALLTLASGQRGLERRERFDLAEVTRAVLCARTREAGERRLHVVAELAPAAADGDPSLAESLVANLIDNALRHNVDGGRVEIRTAASPDAAGLDASRAAAGLDTGPEASAGAAAAIVSVANTGPVIPPGDLGRLFQPFQQLGRERIRGSGAGGHGLGLAIVQAIVTAHGAALTAEARPGGGLDITVAFRPHLASAHPVSGAEHPSGSEGSLLSTPSRPSVVPVQRPDGGVDHSCDGDRLHRMLGPCPTPIP